MPLIDDVKIVVKAGDGGNGATATKQVYASKKTVPDGGNGGNGGNIYFQGSANVSDLSEFQYKKTIKGENGVNGSHKDLDGANGNHVYVNVPLGTTVKDEETGEWVEILTAEPFCVAYGGNGGMGNHDYKPDIKGRWTPRVADGGEGEVRKLHLVLNMIADVGLVGLPNAGKSSLLKKLTNAVPKVGNYPFTTLEPNLGAMHLDTKSASKKSIILADIPGLIEGASLGKGLGLTFLKHIKKTKVLLHCIAVTDNFADSYATVRHEFEAFDKSLLSKKEYIVITKKDLVDESALNSIIEQLKKDGKKVIAVSIYDEQSLTPLKKLLEKAFS